MDREHHLDVSLLQEFFSETHGDVEYGKYKTYFSLPDVSRKKSDESEEFREGILDEIDPGMSTHAYSPVNRA
ncbi:hypothetical protein AVEN_194011-1 [Araneus ventricosus]|uniref:Uncharacterized protein n=1 Tax=Araneus ventricosus TaxID=182803 RepID=A0A4Y2LD56_ARAVE|nr:hypothetical protein AVEN_194011-1 [Araneus ventricosus]